MIPRTFPRSLKENGRNRGFRPSLNREASRLGDVVLGLREHSPPIVVAYRNRLKSPNIRPISFVALRNSSPQAGDLWDPTGTPEAPGSPAGGQ